MAELQELSPQERAVLSLVIGRGKHFEEIGRLLHIDPTAVRWRTYAAALKLVPAPLGLGLDPVTSTLDYVFGLEGPERRGVVQAQLRVNEDQREWARELTAALAPIARVSPPAAAPAPRWRLPYPRRRELVVASTVLTLAVVAVAVVLAVHTGPRTTRVAVAVPAVQTVKQISLSPSTAMPHALGAASIVRRGTALVLLMRATGLTPNRADAYAVWLLNSPQDAQLLGFVSPPVGRTGSFSSSVTLPADAIRFSELAITEEAGNHPRAPGAIVLHGLLPLS